MGTAVFAVVFVVVVVAALRWAAWRDDRFHRQHCQVCSGPGAAVLTVIEPGRFVCAQHRAAADRIALLEADLFGDPLPESPAG